MNDSADSADRKSLPRLDLSGLDVEQAVRQLIEHAVNLPASDVFLSADNHEGIISVRHLGTLKQLGTLPRDEFTRLVNHVKAVAGMAVDQRHRPLDGRWVTEREGKRVDLRISTIPTIFGEDMSIRLLECDLALLDLNNLGLHRRNVDELTALLLSPGGLILMTGPGGAGKTTTLYACLNYLSDGTRRINTVEDPVEMVMDGVRQSEVRPRIHLDFPEMLRSILRQFLPPTAGISSLPRCTLRSPPGPSTACSRWALIRTSLLPACWAPCRNDWSADCATSAKPPMT
jgi:type II secretory ATPase GspE/PulE/Tfp pilus assembly ATPase PilB-like protein